MLDLVASFVINTIERLGYGGIVLTMAIESALIPLPSEIIMPFSGYLVSLGKFNLLLVSFFGALGNLIGSLLAYMLGAWGQEHFVRGLVRRYGKFLLISEHELEVSERWFREKGKIVILISRLLPGIRTVISLPAGIAKMNLAWFSLLTFGGSFIWSYLLAWIGFKLGENWKEIGPIFHQFDALIIAVVIILAILFVYHRTKARTKN